MLLRIDKFISSQKNISRNEVHNLIKNKEVLINNVICKSGSEKIDAETDVVKLCGEEIKYKKHLYLMMNKPKGVVSASKDNIDKTIIDILSDDYKRKNLFCAGRLDKDTTGLLILTDDGEYLHNVISPNKKVYKEYEVEVDKIIQDELKEQIEKGIELKDGTKYMPAFFTRTGEYTGIIRICEGKFHQVKRMCQYCGYKVKELNRIKIGKLSLDGNLEVGQARELSEKEIKDSLMN